MKDKVILVVDDEPDFVELVKSVLVKDGYLVMTAYNGTDALKMAEEILPDCIVLDVMMPDGPDGWEVGKRLKSMAHTEDIPIIMLTAVADHVTTTRYSHYDGMTMEADDYLPKPASADDILESVRSFV